MPGGTQDKSGGRTPHRKRGRLATLRSWRFWAVFLGYLACFAVPLAIPIASGLVGVLTVGFLVAGVAGAILTRTDPSVATGFGCGVAAAIVGVLAVVLLFLWMFSFGTLP